MPNTGLAYEMGPIRPPSEASSLLLRVTRNCPWNKCAFCQTYKGSRFARRSVEEVKDDIRAIKELYYRVKALSLELGKGGRVDQEVLSVAYHRKNQSFFQVAWWMYHGAKNVFLQDADSLILKTPEIVEILTFLKETFPWVERITTYGRSATLVRKSVSEFEELREAGLRRVHLGMESGSDKVLELIKKGTTGAKHLKAGLAIKEAGLSLSLYLILGIGGRELSAEHARESAKLVNEINPDFLRLRSLVVLQKTPLAKMVEIGSFIPLTEDEMVQEERILIENLTGFTGYLVSDHSNNLLMEVEGRFPEARVECLSVIDSYQQLSGEERINFQLGRRVNFYKCIADMKDPKLYQRVSGLLEQIRSKGKDVDEVLFELRRKIL